ncbi:MAG: hypothetical protein KIT34_07920 [Cyanobacteria bacterium TGS_CYA1]|nr:hypothetical protein [Cyanobacteria bacterium TGS_CYA1]
MCATIDDEESGAAIFGGISEISADGLETNYAKFARFPGHRINIKKRTSA